MSDIYGMQLVSGQDLIGTVEGLTDPSCAVVRITKPAAIAMMPSSSGHQMNVGLIPWIPYAKDESFDIPKRSILTWYTPSDDLFNNYNRLFGSGIVVARGMP